MEKRRQWKKPELGVLARSKQKKTAGTARSGNAKYYLGPAPAPFHTGPVRDGDAKYYLGPAPTPHSIGPL